jgi:hypothetical protein
MCRGLIYVISVFQYKRTDQGEPAETFLQPAPQSHRRHNEETKGNESPVSNYCEQRTTDILVGD